MNPRVLAPKGDVIAVLEALYHPEPDFGRWLGDGVRALARVLDDALTPGIGVVAHGDDYSSPTIIAARGTDDAMTDALYLNAERQLGQMGGEGFRIAYYPGGPVVSSQVLERDLTGDGRDIYQAYRSRLGFVDGVGLFAYPQPGVAVVCFCLGDQLMTVSRAEYRVLERLAGHLDTSLRLRLRPESAVAAVVTADGRLADVEDAGVLPQRDVIHARVVGIERTRTRGERREHTAIDHWQALVDGRYSIVPREDADGRRGYLLVHNASMAGAHARLSAREVDVVGLAARGYTGKGIGYVLGLPSSAVSTALGNAAHKVGLRSRTELVNVIAPMFGARGGALDVASLTPAELEVLALIRRGLSNDEIAALRARSTRTVANQVASILLKTKAPSRRALASLDAGEP